MKARFDFALALVLSCGLFLSQERDPVQPPQSDEQDVFAPGLKARILDGLAEGWRKKRSEDIPPETLARGLKEFEELVRSYPTSRGLQLAREQGELEYSLEREDILVILEDFADDKKGAVRVVHDAAKFASFFESQSTEQINGSLHIDDLGAQLEEGSTVTFPAGVYRPEKLMRRGAAFPANVTIQGSGMDSTLLVLSDLSTGEKVVNLGIRDCTVFTDSAYLCDLRRRPATFFLQNVRMIGFDSGAGGSLLFSFPAGAVLARNCRFEGGFGRRPQGYANLVRAQKGVMARFENCFFRDINVPRETGAFHFQDCELNLKTWGGAHLKLESNVELVNSSVTYVDYSKEQTQARDLNELFPNWRERIER